MDLKTCEVILRDAGSSRFSGAVTFRAFRCVAQAVAQRRRGRWAQALLQADPAALAQALAGEWDADKFQSVLLLLASLSASRSHSSHPCSLTTVLQQPYIASLCDQFLGGLVKSKEWTPLQWKAVLNMSRIVPLSAVSKQMIITFALKFMSSIRDSFEDIWMKNCAHFCHSVSSAVFIFIELYQADPGLVDEKSGMIKAIISLVYYFESYSIGAVADNTGSRYHENNNAAEGKKCTSFVAFSWARKLNNKLTDFLIANFRQNYEGGTEVLLEHALLGLDSSSSHIQVSSLLLLICHLKAVYSKPTQSTRSTTIIVQKKEENKKVVTRLDSKERNSGGKLKAQVSKVRNALKVRDAVKKQKPRHVLACEKLYHNGHIRKIYWCLLNEDYRARSLAVEVIGTCEDILNEDISNQHTAWHAYILEQGVVPLLELVACGFPIATTSMKSPDTITTKFPEEYVRLFAQSLLLKLSTVLIDDSALQEKIVMSLTHTKNSSTRGNIFSGLIYLSSKNSSISRLLLKTSKESNGNSKSIFGYLLSEIYLEETLLELKHVVKIIHHFFYQRNSRVAVMQVKSQQLDIQKKGKNKAVKEKLSLSAEVLIKDKFNGSMVKMQCPDKKTLKEHSNRLALLMESDVSQANPDSKDRNVAILPGYYHIWQEIFSHMIDDYVMDTTLAASGVEEILEFYQYACKYELSHLCMRYTKELINRLSTESFIQIFQCSIKMMTETSNEIADNHKIDPTAFNLETFPHKLSLCCTCMKFFIDKISKVSSPQNLQRKIILSETLELYFQFIVIAQ